MAALVTAGKQTFTFCDEKFNRAKSVVYLPSSLTPAQAYNQGYQIGADMYAIQTGRGVLDLAGTDAVLRSHGPYTTQAQPYGGLNSSGSFRSVEDKAVYVFQDSAGILHRYQVACPEIATFMADQETVDASVGDVKQFIADMLHQTFAGTAPNTDSVAPIVSAQGNPLLFFVGGYRRRAKNQKRINIFTLSSGLDEPAE